MMSNEDDLNADVLIERTQSIVNKLESIYSQNLNTFKESFCFPPDKYKTPSNSPYKRKKLDNGTLKALEKLIQEFKDENPQAKTFQEKELETVGCYSKGYYGEVEVCCLTGSITHYIRKLTNENEFKVLLFIMKNQKNKKSNLAEYYSFSISESGYPQIVMEWGIGTLRDFCKHFKIMEEMILYITSCIIEQIKYLRDLGIFHRDIKPENIIITEDLNFKLIDFSISEQTDPSNKDGDDTWYVTGTDEYLPEDLRKKMNNNERYSLWKADLHALAVTIEKISGGLSTKEGIKEIISKLKNGEIPDICEKTYEWTDEDQTRFDKIMKDNICQVIANTVYMKRVQGQPEEEILNYLRKWVDGNNQLKEEHSKQLSALLEKNEILKAHLDEKEKELGKLDREKEALENELKKQQELYAELEKDNKKVRTENGRFADELSSTQTNFKLVQKENMSLQAEIESKSAKIEQIKKKEDKLQQELNSAKVEHENLKIRLSKVSENLQKEMECCQNLKNQLEKTRDALQKEKHIIQKSLSARYRSQLNKHKEELVKIRDQLNRMEALKNDLRNTIDTLNTNLTEQKAHIENLKKQIQRKNSYLWGFSWVIVLFALTGFVGYFLFKAHSEGEISVRDNTYQDAVMELKKSDEMIRDLHHNVAGLQKRIIDLKTNLNQNEKLTQAQREKFELDLKRAEEEKKQLEGKIKEEERRKEMLFDQVMKKIEEELKIKNEKIHVLQMNNIDLELKYNSSEKTNLKNQEKIRELTAELASMKQQISELEIDVAQCSNTVIPLMKKVNETQLYSYLLESKLAQCNETTIELLKKNNKSEESRSLLSSELAECNKTVIELVKQNNETQVSKSLLESNLTQCSEVNIELLERNREYEESTSLLESGLAQCKQEASELKWRAENPMINMPIILSYPEKKLFVKLTETRAYYRYDVDTTWKEYKEYGVWNQGKFCYSKGCFIYTQENVWEEQYLGVVDVFYRVESY